MGRPDVGVLSQEFREKGGKTSSVVQGGYHCSWKGNLLPGMTIWSSFPLGVSELV